MADPADDPPCVTDFAIPLGVLFSINAVLCAFQLTRILLNGHSLRSFHFGFLLLCFVWSTIRLIFWFNTGEWSLFIVLMLFRSPYVLEFATYSLLLVYFTREVYRDLWNDRHTLILSLWVAINFLMMAFLFSWLGVLCAKFDTCDLDQHIGAFSLVIGSLYLLLSLVLFYYAFNMFQLSRSSGSSPDFRSSLTESGVSSGGGASSACLWWPSAPAPTQVTQRKAALFRSLSLLTLLLTLFFATRCAYDFFSGFGIGAITLSLQGAKCLDLVGFLLFVVWEVFPTLIVLGYFRKIPTQRGGIWDSIQHCLPCFSQPDAGVSSSSEQSYSRPSSHVGSIAVPKKSIHFFDDPNRYDSDDSYSYDAYPSLPSLRAGDSFAPAAGHERFVSPSSNNLGGFT